MGQRHAKLDEMAKPDDPSSDFRGSPPQMAQAFSDDRIPAALTGIVDRAIHASPDEAVALGMLVHAVGCAPFQGGHAHRHQKKAARKGGLAA